MFINFLKYGCSYNYIVIMQFESSFNIKKKKKVVYQSRGYNNLGVVTNNVG